MLLLTALRMKRMVRCQCMPVSAISAPEMWTNWLATGIDLQSQTTHLLVYRYGTVSAKSNHHPIHVFFF